MPDTQNADSIATLIASELDVRDDIASAVPDDNDVYVRTQAGEVFEVVVTQIIEVADLPDTEPEK